MIHCNMQMRLKLTLVVFLVNQQKAGYSISASGDELTPAAAILIGCYLTRF